MKPKIEIRGEIIVVNEQILADALGLTTRMIQKLAEEGVETVIRVGPSKFDLVQSVFNYIDHLRNEKKQQKEEKVDAETALKLEQIKHEKLKARKTELAVQLIEKDIHLSEDVERLWNASVINAKTRLSSIPEKIVPALVGIEDPKEIKTILKREIHEALAEVSEYDASKFDNRAGAREEKTEDGDEE